MEMIPIIDLKIDPEFESLIPSLTEAEFKQLEENIVDDGEVLNPIITWQGVIIDGHNRWKIIQNNPGIPFKTHELIFFDRYQAKEWILKNQLGRRNITNEQRLRLIGQMQENRKCKESFKGNQYTVKNGEVQNEPNQKPKSTAAQIAEEVGVSESTVKRAEKFSKGIDAIQSVSPEAAQKILKGGSGVTKAEVMSVPEMDDDEKEVFVDKIINPQDVEEKKPMQREYTINDLLDEINSNADTYLRFLKSTLVSRSTLYADKDNRCKVFNAVSNIKLEIEKMENLLK